MQRIMGQDAYSKINFGRPIIQTPLVSVPRSYFSTTGQKLSKDQQKEKIMEYEQEREQKPATEQKKGKFFEFIKKMDEVDRRPAKP